MKSVARLAVRKDQGTKGVLIGFVHDTGPLEPDVVYEILEILGELHIRKIGLCSNPLGWHKDISRLISESPEDVLMTQAELDSIPKE